MKSGLSYGLLLLLLGLVLAVLVVFALGQGAYPLSGTEVLRALVTGFGSDLAVGQDQAVRVVWDLRLPRIAAALLVGAALSTAGAAYQTMFRNPLVSPDILGVSSGAGLGAILAIYLNFSLFGVQMAAFVGGLLAVGIVLSLARMLRHHPPILILVLAGMAVGTLLGAALSLIKILADPYSQLPSMTFWLLGGLSAVRSCEVWPAALMVLACIVPVWLLRWRINVLALQDEEARSLGMPVSALRCLLIVCATLMTAVCVALAGIIGWVGLLIPHAARLLVGPDFSRLLPVCLLVGAAFLLLTDTLARSIGTLELPLGVLTALVGAPGFLLLLARGARQR
ncbi:FecCD family ABC transporter permease [Alcaligenes faecalis]|uniref:Iron ABC transporter permease n=1 Tax=Alcaligenes faecalis TaxID=511 RepID=A0AAE9KQH0_ALCFA|nr:iron ABC transporter permease [Alcaligenes faecalis]UPL22175.1 iron ABC transporter permease [Alcaligenes faecalis]